jgi:hypothetical protein
MKRWLTHKCTFPRWLVILLIVLAAAAFVLPYVRTNELLNENRGLRVELKKAQDPTIGCILLFDYPFWGALANYPRVVAGLACTLLVLAGLFWGLRGRRSSPDNRPPITNYQSPIPDHQ